MSKFMAIILLVAFVIAAVFAPAVAMAGGEHHGGGGEHHGGGGGCIPEIDPGVASSAIALLTCGVLILAGRFRRE